MKGCTTAPHSPSPRTCVACQEPTVGQGDDLAPQLSLCPVLGGHVEEELILQQHVHIAGAGAVPHSLSLEWKGGKNTHTGLCPLVPVPTSYRVTSTHHPSPIAGCHVEEDVPPVLPPRFGLQCDPHHFAGRAHHPHLQARRGWAAIE